MQTLNCNKWLCILKFNKIQFLKCALSSIFTWEKQHALFVNLFHLNTRPILTMQTLNCNKCLCILKFTASLSLGEWYNFSGCINVQLKLPFHIFEIHKRCLICDVNFLFSFFRIAVILQYSCQQMSVSALPYQNTILKMWIKCNFFSGRSNMGYLLIYFILIQDQFCQCRQ